MNAELHTPTAPASVLATLPILFSYTVTVKPDESGGGTFTYSNDQGPVSSPLSIDVPANEIAMIQFTLDVSSGEYVWNPVNWFSKSLPLGGLSISRPSIMVVTRESVTMVTVLDDNSQSGIASRFNFTLSVLLGGQVYTSSDPTIINHPDGQ